MNTKELHRDIIDLLDVLIYIKGIDTFTREDIRNTMKIKKYTKEQLIEIIADDTLAARNAFYKYCDKYNYFDEYGVGEIINENKISK